MAFGALRIGVIRFIAATPAGLLTPGTAFESG
jgi:hypothetical protein